MKILGNDIVSTSELQQYITRIQSAEKVIETYAKLHKFHLSVEVLLVVVAAYLFFR